MIKFPFMRHPVFSLILVGLLVTLMLVTRGCARPLDPSHVSVSNLRIEQDILRCDVMDGFDSALYLRDYSTTRRKDEIFVRFYTGMFLSSNHHPVQLREIEIKLRDTDRAVVFTDGKKCIEIWKRPQSDTTDHSQP